MKAIMAISENGVIGNKGELPWYIPEDMARFVELTKDHDLLMGRKTFESLPMQFFENHKDTRFIILTSDPNDVMECISEVGLDDYCTFRFVTPTELGHFLYAWEDVENIMVIGGAEIYAKLLPHINTFYLTEVYKDVEGDATFDTTYLKQEFTEHVIDTIFSYGENCHVSFYEYIRDEDYIDLDEEFMRTAKDLVVETLVDSKPSKHKAITEELNDIYKRKNADYGDAFGDTFRKLGIISAVTRISDKTNRLMSLAAKSEADRMVKDESIRDTLMDLANYAIMSLIEMDESENK